MEKAEAAYLHLHLTLAQHEAQPKVDSTQINFAIFRSMTTRMYWANSNPDISKKLKKWFSTVKKRTLSADSLFYVLLYHLPCQVHMISDIILDIRDANQKTTHFLNRYHSVRNVRNSQLEEYCVELGSFRILPTS